MAEMNGAGMGGGALAQMIIDALRSKEAEILRQQQAQSLARLQANASPPTQPGWAVKPRPYR